MQSFSKKLITLAKDGMKPLSVGFENFKNPKEEVEELAKERLFHCINCKEFIEEPIDFLKVEDKRIPELSNKMCDECGCTLSYKLRQSIKICDKWQK